MTVSWWDRAMQAERELAAVREEVAALRTETDTLRREHTIVTNELAAARETRDRYERAIRELAKTDRPVVLGISPGDWEEYVQQTCLDLLDGIEASCANCGTEIHDGPRVGDFDEDEDAAVTCDACGDTRRRIGPDA
jgi:hypothetical protein